MKLGKFQECYDVSKLALETFEKFHYSNDIWFARRIALSKKNLGNPEDAIKELQQILRKKKEWFIQKELAELYKEEGKNDKAFDLAIDAINNFGDLEFKIDLLYLLGELLKAKGIDVVFRHTADGRIYGATFIDHRTQSVFNGSRLGTNLSANALQEHFTLPYENEQPIPLTIPKEDGTMPEQEYHGSGLFDEYGSGLGLMAGNGSSNEAQEAAFDRELRRKKKKRKGRNL